MPSLDGRWRVERESGLLPPAGVGKRIAAGEGWTTLGGFPVGFFRVEGTTLVYSGLPVRDELTPRGDGTWSGRSLVGGQEFCRFHLIRDET